VIRGVSKRHLVALGKKWSGEDFDPIAMSKLFMLEPQLPRGIACDFLPLFFTPA
jgi:hypothetical protein